MLFGPLQNRARCMLKEQPSFRFAVPHRGQVNMLAQRCVMKADNKIMGTWKFINTQNQVYLVGTRTCLAFKINWKESGTVISRKIHKVTHYTGFQSSSCSYITNLNR